MNVQELIERLQQLPPDSEVKCQVVGTAGAPRAWNMLYTFIDVPQSGMVQLRVFHPELRELPSRDCPECRGL